MQITEIYYEKVFPIAPYVNEKIGVKITLDKEESPELALQVAKDFVNKSGYKLMEDRPSGEARVFDAPAQIRSNAMWDTPPYGTGDPAAVDQEFQELKKQIDTFLTEDSASLYLQTTPFKFSVEAKNYIKERFKKEE